MECFLLNPICLRLVTWKGFNADSDAVIPGSAHASLRSLPSGRIGTNSASVSRFSASVVRMVSELGLYASLSFFN